MATILFWTRDYSQIKYKALCELTHLRSISSRIQLASASPCIYLRYSPIQIMRWSLKMPLINWWRRSGDSILKISAYGKSFVNGCHKQLLVLHHQQVEDNILLDTPLFHIDPTAPQSQMHGCSIQRVSEIVEDYHVHRDYWTNLYSYQKLHVSTVFPLIKNKSYSGHHPCTMHDNNTCSG